MSSSKAKPNRNEDEEGFEGEDVETLAEEEEDAGTLVACVEEDGTENPNVKALEGATFDRATLFLSVAVAVWKMNDPDSEPGAAWPQLGYHRKLTHKLCTNLRPGG